MSHVEALYDVHDKLLLVEPVETSVASRRVQQEDHISFATAKPTTKTTSSYVFVAYVRVMLVSKQL